MVTFTEIELHSQWIDFNEEERTYNGTKTPSSETLEELIAADTDRKIREFTAQWFPFMDIWKSWEHPDFDEEVKAASDTRDLMLLVLELKRMVDEGDCSRGSFMQLGTQFGKGGTEKHEQANLHYLATSESFSRYIRAHRHCESVEESFVNHYAENHMAKQKLIEDGYLDEEGNVYCPFAALSYATKAIIEDRHLYLNGQESRVEALDDEARYPVMNFFGGNLGKRISCTEERAYFFIDGIIGDCIQGLRIETRDGILAPKADNNFTSLWLCLSDSFRESRVTACKTCGLPIIVTGERGTKRLYCNDTCKRKYKRALKFASLVNDEGMDPQAAAKVSGMAIATATRILDRNDIHVNFAQ